MLASLPVPAAYLTGPDLTAVCVNDAYLEFFGERAGPGRPLREVLPEAACRACGQAMASGQPARVRGVAVRVRRAGRTEEERVADLACQPVRGPQGAVSGLMLCPADVTAAARAGRRAETLTQELAAAGERYQALFTALPQGVIHASADGGIIAANPAATGILGRDLTAPASWAVFPPGQALREDGTPLPPEELPLWRVLRGGDAVATAVVAVPHGRTGETRWLRVTAVAAGPREQGLPGSAYAVFTDLTQQRRMEAELRESTGLLSKLRESNVLGVVASTEDGAYDANDAFLDLIGCSRDDLAAGRIFHQKVTPPEWAEADREALAQLRHTGAFQPYGKEYTHRDGHRVPVIVGGAVVSQQPLRWVTFVVDLTARQRAERERAELRERERAAHAQAGYARERLTFLLRAGSMVAATRDPQEMLEHAAQLVVPALADHCVVMLPAPDGSLQATSLAHSDPARAPVLAEFGHQKVPAAGPMSTQVAFQTGTSQLTQDVHAKLPEWQSLAPGLIDILARLRANSVLATPIMIGSRPAGVLTLARDASRLPFAATDAEVMEEFARRLADGLATADTFAREHTIAETLQRSLLPGAFPDVAGLDLAVSYLPASDGAHVGGDWYDAFPLRGGAIGLVVGDIAGHDLAAAAVMGQVRSLLRAYALDDPDPAEVLRRTGDALGWLLPEALASVVYGVLDPASGRFTYANAGHPPPLLRTGTGQADYLDDAPGTMLGAGSGTQVTSHRRLPPGSGVLFYTDGLIEDRDRDISAGLNTLAGVLRNAPVRTAAEICAAAQQVLDRAPARADDVCLLAVRLPG